jgi:hypothetical protein
MNNKQWIAFALCAGTIGAAPAFAQNAAPNMSFFITSAGSGQGANLDGLAGADAHCDELATAVGAGNKTWRAYLSATAAGGQPQVNARDRVGSGPWFNSKGVQIAASVADLHSDNNKIDKENGLTEKGTAVNGVGDTPNTHDILTGSGTDGRLAPPAPIPPPPNAPAGTQPSPAPANLTCNNWTGGDTRATVGHHDGMGFGPTGSSWNSAHASRGCSQEELVVSGGAGMFYCFATD